MTNLIIFFLFGLVLAYVFKSYRNYEVYSKEVFKNFEITKENLQKSDLGLFVALVAKVAKADGHVDTLEAELVKALFDDVSRVFPDPKKAREYLKEIFNEEKERSDNLEHIAVALAQSIKRNKAKQEQFIGFLIQLAFADGEVTKSEERILGRIAEAMEIDPNLYHKIFDMFEQLNAQRADSQQTSLEEAYKILGVRPNDDMESIKKAYRKLVRQYHPDIIKAQGKDEAYLKEATQKTQEINEAYEIIKKARA
ncbi:MAG: DnaJ domain-containing protein [Epsilonproteobacteria bacterium]|nr:DnaJ domain-containing protein [Campylobacterota bacterium]